MKIDILTLFPEMFQPLNQSLLGKAQDNNLIDIVVTDIRNYSANKHAKCDDYPYGGGAGMVMTAQPIDDAIVSVDPDHQALRIYLSPRGKVLSQDMVVQLSQHDRLLLLCGHYEGVDQRVLDMHIDMELSIGDYVLSGGEIPAMVVVDAIARYVPDVLGNSQTVVEESFADGLLEYPQYTRPQTYKGMTVPEVLTNGNHANIASWRAKQSYEITKKNRPDLLQKKEQK